MDCPICLDTIEDCDSYTLSCNHNVLSGIYVLTLLSYVLSTVTSLSLGYAS